MAIVNRTPDSFYDRGATFTDEAAKAAARRVIEEGADVVDVGGVKAGPGGPVDIDEEIARVVPFIEWLRDAYPDQLISVDTWRSEVAKQACAAGADLINDTWGGHDPGLAEVAAEFGAGLVCSHTGGATPRTRPFRVNYGTTERGVVDDVIAEDYLLTNRFYRRDPTAGTDLPNDVRQAIGSVDASFLAAGIEAVSADYGDLESYFRDGLGLGDRERAALKQRYLQS